MTYDNDYTAMRALATRLSSVFATAPLVTKYVGTNGYGGVDVIVVTDEDDEVEHVGRPMVLLEQTDGSRSETSSARDEYRTVTVSATTLVSEHAGSVVGTANPTAADELLSRDLVAEIKAGYETYRDMGLEGISITAQGLQKSQGETVRRIGHSIQFEYSR